MGQKPKNVDHQLELLLAVLSFFYDVLNRMQHVVETCSHEPSWAHCYIITEINRWSKRNHFHLPPLFVEIPVRRDERPYKSANQRGIRVGCFTLPRGAGFPSFSDGKSNVMFEYKMTKWSADRKPFLFNCETDYPSIGHGLLSHIRFTVFEFTMGLYNWCCVQNTSYLLKPSISCIVTWAFQLKWNSEHVSCYLV